MIFLKKILLYNMNPQEYDKKISQFKNEDPKKYFDTTHLEEFDIVDGKSRKEQDIQHLRDLEELLGVKDVNPYGTLNQEIFAERIDSMTLTDLQNLAIRVGIPPARNNIELKKNLKRSLEIYIRQHNIGSSVAARPVIDPSSPNYESVVRLFKEGI